MKLRFAAVQAELRGDYRWKRPVRRAKLRAEEALESSKSKSVCK